MAERARRRRLDIREIDTPGDSALRPAHQLLRRAFTRAEMLPLGDWQNALRERSHSLWLDQSWHLLVAQRGGKLLAAATGAYLGNVNVGIVGYIAVTPEARSLGIGPRMRRALRRKFDADARRIGRRAAAAIIGEVKADNPWLGHLVRVEGAIALDFPYFQPSLGGGREPVPLVLYYHALAEPRASLSAAETRQLLYTVWRRVYRIARPLDHPEFRRMLRALEGRRRIGQRAEFRALAKR